MQSGEPPKMPDGSPPALGDKLLTARLRRATYNLHPIAATAAVIDGRRNSGSINNEYCLDAILAYLLNT